MTETQTNARGIAHSPLSWRSIIAATLLTAGTIALIWLAAVPFGPVVCPAIHPAPRNCFASDRAGTGLIVTVVLIIIYAGTAAFALFRPRHGRPFVIAGVTLLSIAPVITYLAVAWIPGFAIA